jgi:hypothetical protein
MGLTFPILSSMSHTTLTLQTNISLNFSSLKLFNSLRHSTPLRVDMYNTSCVEPLLVTPSAVGSSSVAGSLWSGLLVQSAPAPTQGSQQQNLDWTDWGSRSSFVRLTLGCRSLAPSFGSGPRRVSGSPREFVPSSSWTSSSSTPTSVAVVGLSTCLFIVARARVFSLLLSLYLSVQCSRNWTGPDQPAERWISSSCSRSGPCRMLMTFRLISSNLILSLALSSDAGLESTLDLLAWTTWPSASHLPLR